MTTPPPPILTHYMHTTVRKTISYHYGCHNDYKIDLTENRKKTISEVEVQKNPRKLQRKKTMLKVA